MAYDKLLHQNIKTLPFWLFDSNIIVTQIRLWTFKPCQNINSNELLHPSILRNPFFCTNTIQSSIPFEIRITTPNKKKNRLKRSRTRFGSALALNTTTAAISSGRLSWLWWWRRRRRQPRRRRPWGRLCWRSRVLFLAVDFDAHSHPRPLPIESS